MKRIVMIGDDDKDIFRFFNNSAEFWMNLQLRYELESERALPATIILFSNSR